jgi:hypothetical protein
MSEQIQDFPAAADAEPPLRGEWEELDAIPKHRECPLVEDTDAATRSVEKAESCGLIDPKEAAARRGIINMRRIIIAETQEAHGCPRQDMTDEERKDDEKTYNCKLPCARTENTAFGTSDQIPMLLSRQKLRDMTNNVETGFTS